MSKHPSIYCDKNKNICIKREAHTRRSPNQAKREAQPTASQAESARSQICQPRLVPLTRSLSHARRWEGFISSSSSSLTFCPSLSVPTELMATAFVLAFGATAMRFVFVLVVVCTRTVEKRLNSVFHFEYLFAIFAVRQIAQTNRNRFEFESKAACTGAAPLLRVSWSTRGKTAEILLP